MTSIAELIEFLRMCGTINVASVLGRLDNLESQLDRIENDTQEANDKIDDLLSTLRNV